MLRLALLWTVAWLIRGPAAKPQHTSKEYNFIHKSRALFFFSLSTNSKYDYLFLQNWCLYNRPKLFFIQDLAANPLTRDCYDPLFSPSFLQEHLPPFLLCSLSSLTHPFWFGILCLLLRSWGCPKFLPAYTLFICSPGVCLFNPHTHCSVNWNMVKFWTWAA